MLLLLFFALLSGFVTILAPCIWPVLPIVLSSSIAGGRGHQRSLGITLGVMLSFSVLTLSISYLIHIFNLDPNILRLFAVVIIALLGVTMIIPSLTITFEIFVSKLANLFGQNVNRKQGSGFLPGFVTGLSLGIVWSPCAGPILATIATLAATGKVTLDIVLVTIFYVIGVGLPLFAFAYGGQFIITRTKGINKYTGRIQKFFGIVMIMTALAIFTNYDKVVQVKLLNMFPQLGSVLNGFERSSFVTQQLDLLRGNNATNISNASELLNIQQPAEDFIGITKWLNANKPVTLASLKGKVVLVDFWTYTCINCLRTLPHTTAWYEKYKDKGFIVIGIHTPEFQFEHETKNVMNALNMYHIRYPVGQDNDYATWNNYHNQYWPAEYLIDSKGTVRRVHFGEGEYDKMEMAIKLLLQEAGKKVTNSLIAMSDQTPKAQLSPETYLGAKRMQYYYPTGILSTGSQQFTLSNSLPNNSFSLGGEWNITDENAITGVNAVLNYHFTANRVFLVLRPSNRTQQMTVKVLLDGKPINATIAGTDVVNGYILINEDRLYNLVDLKGKVGTHMLELEFQQPGIQAFAFTFG